MWIKIKSKDGPNLSIPVPLFLGSSRLVWSLVNRFDKSGSALQYGPATRKMAGELRSYVRKHGHFCLVDVESADDDIIKITV